MKKLCMLLLSAVLMLFMIACGDQGQPNENEGGKADVKFTSTEETGTNKEGLAATAEPTATPKSIETPNPKESPIPAITPEPDKKTAAGSETEVEKKEQVYYAVTELNVRSVSSTEGKIVGTLAIGEKVQGIGVCTNGWIQIMYQEEEAYASGNFLSTEPVEAEKEKPKKEQEAKQEKREAVKAQVQLYEGIYRDQREFGEDGYPFTYCEVAISNITESSFDFTVNETHYDLTQDGGSEVTNNVIFLTNTAVFIGDGTEAAFYGHDYTLHFSFPDYHSAYPSVTDMEISGFEPLEGNIYVNNKVPGHEFN